jgi:phospholipid/cholesterol/gamma-HCH transport system permease protein
MNSTADSQETGGRLDCTRPAEDILLVSLSGNWNFEDRLPQAEDVQARIEGEPGISKIGFDTAGLTAWDSGLLTFLIKVMRLCSDMKIAVIQDGLPQGVQRLLALAFAVPERQGARKTSARIPFLARIGDGAIHLGESFVEILTFIGEIFLSFLRLCTGKAQFRRVDMWLTIQQCGAEALPIVSLISLLVGLILAFVGAIQLKLFGAQIYVADLVGIAMVRAMGAIMTGIIMAGRTGASFAARIGTMQGNEEIDALQTAGISPIDFLVLPRVFALSLMMPLLTLYADLMGILGGMIVGVLGLDITMMQYFNETKGAVTLTNVWIGLISGLVYGVIIAVAGCLRGMQCGRSASAVGDATTSAVVTSIVSIIVATAIITVICNVLGI